VPVVDGHTQAGLPFVVAIEADNALFGEDKRWRGGRVGEGDGAGLNLRTQLGDCRNDRGGVEGVGGEGQSRGDDLGGSIEL
jgi:hypothetical protein